MVVHGQLTLEPEGRSRHERLVLEEAGVVEQVPRGHVVRAVEHDVVVLQDLARVRAVQGELVGADQDL